MLATTSIRVSGGEVFVHLTRLDVSTYPEVIVDLRDVVQS